MSTIDFRSGLAEIAEAKGTIDEGERLRRLFDLDWRYTLQESPELATMIGVPGHNDRWSDFSREAIDRHKSETIALAGAAAAVDRDALGEEDRLNCDLFRRHVDEAAEGVRFPRERLMIGPMHGPQSATAQILAFMPRASTEALGDVLARLDAIPVALEQMRGLLEEGLASGITPPRVTLQGIEAQIAAHATEDGNPLLGPLAQIGPGVPVAEAERARTQAAAIVRDKVAPAFAALGSFFTETYEPGCRTTIALTDLPDGEDWYAHLVRTYTTTSLTPKEIHEIGLAEVERIRAEMDSTIADASFEGSFEQFCEFLRTDARFFFESAEDLLAAYRDIAKRADPKLIEMFATLPRTPYGVEPVPAHQETTSTTAYYIPGSAEAGRPGTFYANTYDLMSRPRWEMEALTLHEAVPGHHLQISLAQEQGGEVPEFRKHAHFTAFVEGWGLYAESLGPEMGFYTDPYSRFGQLTYEMWRAIRLVVDTGMHAFGWTREQSLDLFKRNTGKTEHDITVEVDRYISWPGQALAYKIGELKLKELRAHATTELGERFDVRIFHDELLRYGALPLDLLETRMREWVARQPR